MNKILKDLVILSAAAGTGYCAYRWMSPMDKMKISREVKRTVNDIGDVKDDMAHMAGTIKETF